MTLVTKFYVSNFKKQILTFYENSDFVFFFLISAKRGIGFYKLSFCFFCFNYIPRISTLIPHIVTQIHRIPTPFPTFLAFLAVPPRFPTFPFPFPAFLLLFPAFPPHSPHSPHSVPRFPIPALTDSRFNVWFQVFCTFLIDCVSIFNLWVTKSFSELIFQDVTSEK